MVFLVQFGINLQEWAFWKTPKYKFIPRKTVWLLINKYKHENIRVEEVLEDLSWSHFFLIWGNVFQSLCTKFSSSFYQISLAEKISYCLSANHNPELRCVICTGVTLFVLVLHLNCTILGQSESSNVYKFPFSPDHHFEKIIILATFVNILWIFKVYKIALFHVHDKKIAENGTSWLLTSFQE